MSIHESSTITFSSTERLKHLSNTSPCNYSPFHRLLCILCNITTSSPAFSISLLPFSRTKSRTDVSTTRLLPLQRLTLTASRSSLNASCLFSATCATYVTMSPCSDSSPAATSLLRNSLRLANCLCALTRTNVRQTHMWSLRQTAGSACSM
jgi:hypothetical protein